MTFHGAQSLPPRTDGIGYHLGPAAAESSMSTFFFFHVRQRRTLAGSTPRS